MNAANDPLLRLESASLLSKWGFCDGEPPEAWLDWCEAQGINYDEIEFPWEVLVREHLIPVLDQNVTVVALGTHHNPVRVQTVNGVDVSQAWYGRAEDPLLTPAFVDVPMSEVLRLARR